LREDRRWSNVRVIELSNHPRELLAQAAAPRLAVEGQAQREWERACETQTQRIEELRVERTRARESRRLGKWLSASLKLVALPGPPPQPRPLQPSREEYRKAAGVEGEDGVIDHLAARLGDEWRALRGYRNHRGEIDVLLLGPKGLFALEIKNINVTIVCRGDRWHYQKYDKYGNPVGDGGTLTDDAGRSPSQQLNEPTDELTAALAGRHPQLWLFERVVVLFHPRGWVDIDRSSNLTVAVANEVDFVLQLIAESRVEIPPDAIPELEAMIVADHRRQNRSAPDSPRPANPNASNGLRRA
jgi:hypothetical protein